MVVTITGIQCETVETIDHTDQDGVKIKGKRNDIEQFSVTFIKQTYEEDIQVKIDEPGVYLINITQKFTYANTSDGKQEFKIPSIEIETTKDFIDNEVECPSVWDKIMAEKYGYVD